MNKERLLKLATFLETKVPSDQFDFGSIGHISNVSCKFAGCAIGWLPSCFPEDIVGDSSSYGYDVRLKSREKGGYQSFNTAVEYLDISPKDAAYLFGPECYVDGSDTYKYDVAERIREYVHDNGIYEDQCYDHSDNEDWGWDDDDEE